MLEKSLLDDLKPIGQHKSTEDLHSVSVIESSYSNMESSCLRDLESNLDESNRVESSEGESYSALRELSLEFHDNFKVTSGAEVEDDIN